MKFYCNPLLYVLKNHHLISPHSNTADSFIKVIRMNEMIADKKISKLSLSAQ